MRSGAHQWFASRCNALDDQRPAEKTLGRRASTISPRAVCRLFGFLHQHAFIPRTLQEKGIPDFARLKCTQRYPIWSPIWSPKCFNSTALPDPRLPPVTQKKQSGHPRGQSAHDHRVVGRSWECLGWDSREFPGLGFSDFCGFSQFSRPAI